MLFIAHSLYTCLRLATPLDGYSVTTVQIYLHCRRPPLMAAKSEISSLLRSPARVRRLLVMVPSNLGGMREVGGISGEGSYM